MKEEMPHKKALSAIVRCEMMGCCADKSCTSETCMNLPDGKTCGDCVHIKRCKAIFGHTETDTVCDWFPRKFRQRDLDADDLDGSVQKSVMTEQPWDDDDLEKGDIDDETL